MKGEQFSTVDGNANWNNPSGKQYGGSSKNLYPLGASLSSGLDVHHALSYWPGPQADLSLVFNQLLGDEQQVGNHTMKAKYLLWSL